MREFLASGLRAGPLQRYAVALIAVALVAAVRLALDPWLMDYLVHAVLLLAVMIGSWYGGAGPGIAATVASLVVAAWFVPLTTPDVPLLNLQNILREALFLIIAAAVVAMGHGSRRLRIESLHHAEQVRQREQMFSTLANTIPQLAWMADENGWIFWFNQRWFQYTGTSLAELEGWGWRKVHHPEHVERVVEKISRHFRTGEVWEDTFPLRGADGQYRWFLSRAIPIRDQEGKVHRWFGTNTDVTEQLQAQEALQMAKEEAQQQARQAEERQRILAAMVEHIPLGLIVVDRAELRIRMVSRYGRGAGPELEGVKIADVVSKQPLFHTDGRPAGLEELPLVRAVREGQVITGEEWIATRSDGKRFPILCTAAPIRDSDGAIIGGVIGWQDITESKRIQEDLRRLNETLEQRVAKRTREAEQRAVQLRVLNAELVQAEQRERRQLAQVLHDGIQQLLAAAKMRAGSIYGRVDDVVRHELEQIDQLLSQSIEASRVLTIELFPPVLQDRGLVPALHWLGRHMHDKYKLEVDVDTAAEAQPASEETGVLLFHTARELLFNVVKHAGVDRARVTLRRGGNRLALEVVDRGRGMDPSRIAEQGPEVGGLGLFTIRERLQLLGGEFEVQSRPGDGTRIRIVVPDVVVAEQEKREALAAATATRPHPAAPPSALEGRPLRVLLADDHKIVRDGLATLLEEQPDMLVVAEAADGQAAVEMTEAVHPDVVIMDVSMPRLDGIEATRRIVRAHPEVCVIGLSMHERDDVGRALEEAGAAAYLPKDSATDTLIATIRRCAGHGDHTPAASPSDVT